MSFNFSAFQYEKAYEPKRLCNWEIPKIFRNTGRIRWEKGRSGPTKIIADDRGHLLPGIPKGGNPWSGLYRGTHHPPRRIKTKISEESNRPQIQKQAITDETWKNDKTTENCDSGKNQEIPCLESECFKEVKNEIPSSSPPPPLSTSSNLPSISRQKCRDTAENLDEPEGITENSAKLEIAPMVTAIGYKVGKPGPTQCSKLKVYRPPSSAPKAPPPTREETSKKAELAKRIPLTDMDLAIYWDLTDLPKVASMLETTKNRNAVIPEREISGKTREPGRTPPKPPTPEETSVAKFDWKCDENQVGTAEIPSKILENPFKSSEILSKPPIPSEPTESLFKSSQTRAKAMGISIETPLKLQPPRKFQPKHYQSNPELAKQKFSRNCVACSTKPPSQRATSEYKLAFKAGSPYKTISTEALDRLKQSKSLSVPKPKVPYAPKNYNIGSLCPPFSVWAGISDPTYPDHWRLTSTYQHAFKPLERRKTPFIRSIYK